MDLQSMFNNLGRTVKRNAPVLLTGASIAGVIATSILTARATYKATLAIEELEEEEGTIADPRERIKRNVKTTWTLYIPPAIAGAATIGCMVGSSKSSANKTAAAMAAYAISEKRFSEYRDKATEMFNERKEEKIRAAIMQDHLDGRPTPPALLDSAARDRALVAQGEENNEIVVLGPRKVRCFEDYTGRYFLSDKSTIEAAENKVNQRIIRENYCSLSYFYDLLGLGHTQFSDEHGWVNDILEIKFFPLIANEDGEPCLAFEYNYVRPM